MKLLALVVTSKSIAMVKDVGQRSVESAWRDYLGDQKRGVRPVFAGPPHRGQCRHGLLWVGAMPDGRTADVVIESKGLSDSGKYSRQ